MQRLSGRRCVFYSCQESTKDKASSDASMLAVSSNGALEGDYVGSETCKSCHETEYHDWKGSHHERAMMEADATSVLADFNTTFTNQGVTSKFYTKDGKYYVNTEGNDGEYGDFEIIYTFGIEPLQQYIVEFPRGKFQCLRTAWDTEKKSGLIFTRI